MSKHIYHLSRTITAKVFARAEFNRFSVNLRIARATLRFYPVRGSPEEKTSVQQRFELNGSSSASFDEDSN
jgi:hypothetical protein